MPLQTHPLRVATRWSRPTSMAGEATSSGFSGSRPERKARMNLGPVQVVVVGFADEEFVGGVLPELLRLRDREAVRLIDVTFVTKDDDGLLTRMDLGDLAS